MNKPNPDPTIPLFAVGIMFLIAGIVFLAFPAKVRKLDTRMTRYIKDEGEYLFTVRIFGVILLVMAAGMLFLSVVYYSSSR